MATLLALSYYLLCGGGAVDAANPIVNNVGMADPHIHVWSSGPSVDHAFYIYATHDYSANNTGFLMKDWWVWRSADLVSWEEASVLVPDNTPADPSTYDECWATDAATNGAGDAYFFYLSIGAENVAVVNASSPVGPWTDAIDAPLLPASLGSSLDPPTTIRDPSVFWDGAAPLIIFGTFTYYIARLGDDMMSLAEKPRLVTVIDPTGPYGNSTDDKPFVHRKGDLWYLSWGCFYATSNSSYGPYVYRGSFLDTAFIAPAFRTNVTDGPWYSHGDYADRHGSFLTSTAIKAPGHAGLGSDLGSVHMSNDYWVGNDRSHSAESDPANAGYFRDSVMGYVHYRVDGSIAPVLIDEVGVGEYDGSAPRIEAENFFTASGAVRKGHEFVERGEGGESGGGDRIFMAAAGASSLTFPHVRAISSATGGDEGKKMLCFTVWAAKGDGTPSQVTASLASMGNSSVSTALCTITVAATDRGWGAYRTAQCCGAVGRALGNLASEIEATDDMLVTLSFKPSTTQLGRGGGGTRNYAINDGISGSSNSSGNDEDHHSPAHHDPAAAQHPYLRVDSFAFSWGN